MAYQFENYARNVSFEQQCSVRGHDLIVRSARIIAIGRVVFVALVFLLLKYLTLSELSAVGFCI